MCQSTFYFLLSYWFFFVSHFIQVLQCNILFIYVFLRSLLIYMRQFVRVSLYQMFLFLLILSLILDIDKTLEWFMFLSIDLFTFHSRIIRQIKIINFCLLSYLNRTIVFSAIHSSTTLSQSSINITNTYRPNGVMVLFRNDPL